MLDFIKIKNLCSVKDTVKTMRRQVKVGANTCKRPIWQKIIIQNI